MSIINIYIINRIFISTKKFLLLLIVFSETIKNGFYTIKLNPRTIQYKLYWKLKHVKK